MQEIVDRVKQVVYCCVYQHYLNQYKGGKFWKLLNLNVKDVNTSGFQEQRENL